MFGNEWLSDDDLVLCFQPRSIDPPQFIAEDEDELAQKVGEIIGGEQCDRCGNCAYRIYLGGAGPSYAVCFTDVDDEVSRQHGGCGAEYPIRWEKAGKVCF